MARETASLAATWRKGFFTPRTEIGSYPASWARAAAAKTKKTAAPGTARCRRERREERPFPTSMLADTTVPWRGHTDCPAAETPRHIFGASKRGRDDPRR